MVGSEPRGRGQGEAERSLVPASPDGAGPPVDARCREANELLEARRPGDALVLCKQVIAEQPNDVVAVFMAAKCLLELKEPELAYHLFRSLYGIDRLNPEVWANIGHCLAELDHPDPALEWFQRCHGALKDTSNHWSNMASIFARLGRPEAAIEAGEQALVLDGQNLDAKYNLALPYLSMHRWPEGWHCYDQVIGKGKLRPNNDYSPDGRSMLPWWEGVGGNPVIFGEQGLGDAIMFASMLPDTIQCAERVIVDIDLRLFDLFKRSFPEAIVASTSGGLAMRVPVRPTHRLPIASLGNLYRQNDVDFSGMPYLKADPERVLQWHAVLSRLPRPWIGVSWRGGTNTSATRERSMTLDEMLPLFERFRGATFVALNYQPETDGEIAEFEAETGHRIRHWARATRMGANYDETAGLVDALDCVVTVQQSAAHLAGALGRPTWVFVPDRPQWRYGTKGDRMPWYGSVALVRQEGKPWADAVTRAAQQVEAFIGAR